MGLLYPVMSGKKLSVNFFIVICRLHQRKDFLPKEELFIR